MEEKDFVGSGSLGDDQAHSQGVEGEQGQGGLSEVR